MTLTTKKLSLVGKLSPWATKQTTKYIETEIVIFCLGKFDQAFVFRRCNEIKMYFETNNASEFHFLISPFCCNINAQNKTIAKLYIRPLNN